MNFRMVTINARAFLLSLVAMSVLGGCTTVARVMPGADVLWKDDVEYDGDGLTYPKLSSVPDKPEDAVVQTSEEELSDTLQSDLDRAREIRENSENP